MRTLGAFPQQRSDCLCWRPALTWCSCRNLGSDGWEKPVGEKELRESPLEASLLHLGTAFKLQLSPWAPARGMWWLCLRPSQVPHWVRRLAWPGDLPCDCRPTWHPQGFLADPGNCQGTSLLALLWHRVQRGPCPGLPCCHPRLVACLPLQSSLLRPHSSLQWPPWGSQDPM